jgi:2-polyprenyl-3-methyl-5-hydroxy-6-metoxy-1,4-benzoquinol methylase
MAQEFHEMNIPSKDSETASAFASSWNNLPVGSVYTKDQFADWLAPLDKNNFTSRDILELGCGNGSLLIHMIRFHPSSLTGVDLGESVLSATANLAKTEKEN